MKRIAFTVSLVVLVFAAASLAQTITFSPRAKSASVEQELIKLENEWNDATVKRDVAFLDGILANNWTGTDQDGTFLSKAQFLASLKSGKDVISSEVADEMKVRVYGDTAVVTGRNTFKGKLKGKDTSGQERWTDVFVKSTGLWQCVASHWSRIAAK
jgi:ketosteroid isomerase-like protein